jgi:hypothetical protein
VSFYAIVSSLLCALLTEMADIYLPHFLKHELMNYYGTSY